MHEDITLYISPGLPANSDNLPTMVVKLRYEEGKFYALDERGVTLLSDGGHFQIGSLAITIELPQKSNARIALNSLSYFKQVEGDSTLNHLKKLSCKELLPIEFQPMNQDPIDQSQTSLSSYEDCGTQTNNPFLLTLSHSHQETKKLDNLNQYFIPPQSIPDSVKIEAQATIKEKFSNNPNEGNILRDLGFLEDH